MPGKVHEKVGEPLRYVKRLHGGDLVTTTMLQTASHAINTTGKYKGREVYNETNDLKYYAIGTLTTSKWRIFGAVDATGDITPS